MKGAFLGTKGSLSEEVRSEEQLRLRKSLVCEVTS